MRIASTVRVLPIFLLGSVYTACGHDTVEPKNPSSNAASTPAVAVPNADAKPPKVAFENPGGMWMPHQMAAQAETLRSLGVQFDPAELTNPTSSILGAVIFLGGCSASFVSPEGLVITNHHCATGALQYNSTPTDNLLKNGFVAKTRADERSNGPTARAFVTRSVTDVTSRVLQGIDAVKDDIQRHKTIESRQKEIVAECEKGKRDTRCNVANFYDGAAFYQIEQLEIRDLRLVYAPSSGVGNYGGEIDNWRWPRHTGDVSIFRAYVGKDGNPADYAKDNIPYHPAHYLKVAKAPLREGDFVMVAGYPGRTAQLKTKAEVDEAINWYYPRRQAQCEQYLSLLEELKKTDKEIAIKATPLVRGFGNALTNVKGQLEGLVSGGLAAQKAKLETDLRGWIESDPTRKSTYLPALDEMNKVIAEHAQFEEHDASLRELVQYPKLLNAATTIVRMAEERAKPDAERHPDFQERNWKRIEQQQSALEKSYNKALDQALFGKALERAAKTKGKWLIEPKAIADLYAKTKLEPEKTRLELLRTATTATLKKSTDPIIQYALKLRPFLKEAEDRDDRLAGRLAILKPKYIEALRAFLKREVAPDANATLRMTYGTVRGYKPKADAPLFRPFTVLSEVVAKNKDAEPFDAPAGLVRAAKAKKFGSYLDEKLGEVPVDFLADLHITGGNSGSPTINAKGELVGLVFDGNYEAMASDWLFQPSITRSIHVDIRYILWLMDAVDGADHLLREMGVSPNIDG